MNKEMLMLQNYRHLHIFECVYYNQAYVTCKMYSKRNVCSVSHKNYWMCADDVDMVRNDKLKAILNEYFDQQTQTEEHADSPTDPVSYKR